jgi:integrase
MTKRGSRRRGGWRRKGNRLQAYVRLHAHVGGLKTKSYPLTTEPRVIQEWIDKTSLKYRTKHPKTEPGTFAADIAAYLPLLADRPKLRAARAVHLAWWAACVGTNGIRFGARQRETLEPVELERALTALLAAGKAPSTVKKYRMALFHLFTKLNGKNGENPLRDVRPPREADPLPKALPVSIIAAILNAMPDRGQGLRHQDRATVSKTKARLRVIATTGIPHAQLRQITAKDLEWDEPSVLVRGRKKGSGTRTARLPLTPAGVEAFRAMAAAEAWGPFSASSMNASFQRGITHLCATLKEKPETRALGDRLERDLADATPYSLRHSFLTEAQLATGNVAATQRLAMHADIRMTQRYTLAAVHPELKAAALLLAERPIGKATAGATNDPRSGSETRENAPLRARRKIAMKPADRKAIA